MMCFIKTFCRNLWHWAALLLLGFASDSPAIIKEAEEHGLIAPEGFTIERIVAPELLSYPMLASFDEKGRLFVFEATGPNTSGTEEMLRKPAYHVRLLEDTDGDGQFDKSQIFADSIPFPKGGVFYQGSLYVTEAPNLTKYTDTDHDGVADKKEIILSGWNFHANGATLSGPFLGPDGWFYMTDARRGFNIKTKEGTVLSGKATRIWRCRPDGTGLEALAGGGFDNSIEIAFMPSGETLGTMTYFVNPQDGQRDAIMHWVEGGTYPKPNPVIAEDKLILTGSLMPVMTKLARVAPSGIMRYRGNAIGDAYRGNLFTAEFNTGRIMRHIIEREGATFKTRDEVFIKSANPDTHPTDVLQDADGSLLVVVTGGWFSEGCPLSRVAKPDVKGGIYRIRKKGAVPIADPWGKKLNIESLSAENASKYLSDSRPAVRESAAARLVALGNSAISPVLQVLGSLRDEELRAEIAFTLSKIKSEAAREAVRNALNDRGAMVRIAAARALGLAKDQREVSKLSEMVVSDLPPVSRQAATALGQIGDTKAVASLLKAAEKEHDRVLGHAIIHSLIMLKSPAPLLEALQNPSSRVRAAAMIALDQMDGSPLTSKHLSAALASTDSLVRSTGIWVAGHHPEWTDVVVDFLSKTMSRQNATEAETSSMQELMLIFIREAKLQDFIAAQLRSSQTTEKQQALALDVIEKCTLKELPRSWLAAMGELLQAGGLNVQARILSLIESRRITTFNNHLDRIAGDARQPADFRLKALGAKLISQPQLADPEFEFILKSLVPVSESTLRQRAARILAQARLTEHQHLTLARDVIPGAAPFLLPALAEVFEGSDNEEVGLALVEGISKGADSRLDNFSEQQLQKVLAAFPKPVHQQAEPLFGKIRARQAERLANLKKLEVQLKGGDVGEGRKLFFGKASCSVCHAVGPDGGRFGPDLTNIGEIRSKHDVLEAIMYPSASFAREYETVKVITKTETFTGIVKEELADVIVLEVGPAPGLRIPRSEIKSIEPETVSMMPPGLDQALTIEELSHLTAFLEALPYRIDRLLKSRGEK